MSKQTFIWTPSSRYYIILALRCLGQLIKIWPFTYTIAFCSYECSERIFDSLLLFVVHVMQNIYESHFHLQPIKQRFFSYRFLVQIGLLFSTILDYHNFQFSFQLPNNFTVGLSYIFFVMAIWITLVSELFATRICLPHF